MLQQTTSLRNGAMWLAGEASGDYLASLVLPCLQQAMGGAPQFGIGGSKMRQAGLDAWYDSDRLAVRGYVEVLKRIPDLLKIRKDILAKASQIHPRVFIGVDAPDFNLAIERKLRAQKIPTVHFVSPSIWAWRPERITKIAQSVDHMLLVFPFEKEIYDRHQVPATYIGHPLAGIIPMEPDTQGARTELGIPSDQGPVIAVLPGSRIDEVSGCGPLFFQACERLIDRLGGSGHFVIAALDDRRSFQIQMSLSRYRKLSERSTIVIGQSHRAMECSDAVLVASGTAALEAALFKKPMVVGYQMPALTAYVMRKKALIPYVSLPNILAGRMVVPEFLQYNCEPDWMAASLMDLLHDSRSTTDIFYEMHASLLRPTAELATEAICSVMRPE